MERAGKGTAIITGAGGGVAPAVARAFGEAGFELLLVTSAEREESAANLARETGAVAVRGIDLSRASSVTELTELANTSAPVTALICLAGGFATDSSGEGSALLERMLSINLMTAVNAAAAILPGMLERRAGFIGVISANAAKAPAPRSTAYAASKGALHAYFTSLAGRVAEKGVGVSVLTPSTAIDTPGNRAAMPKSDPSQWIDPARLASALLFLAAADRGGRVRELTIEP